MATTNATYLELVTTLDPYAMEVHRDGRSIGVVRWHCGHWTLTVPGDGAATIPWDVIELVAGFRRERER